MHRERERVECRGGEFLTVADKIVKVLSTLDFPNYFFHHGERSSPPLSPNRHHSAALSGTEDKMVKRKVAALEKIDADL
jgi:hypothetical protein